MNCPKETKRQKFKWVTTRQCCACCMLLTDLPCGKAGQISEHDAGKYLQKKLLLWVHEHKACSCFKQSTSYRKIYSECEEPKAGGLNSTVTLAHWARTWLMRVGFSSVLQPQSCLVYLAGTMPAPNHQTVHCPLDCQMTLNSGYHTDSQDETIADWQLFVCSDNIEEA